MNNITLSFGGNIAISKPGFAAGTNTGTIQHTAAIDYAINGIVYTKAATNNITPTGAGTSQAPGTTCLYAVDINSGGSYFLVKGPEVATARLAGNGGDRALELPPPPAIDRCRVGLVRVVNGASGAFVFGTTAFNATGVTTTFFDLLTQPSVPFQS